MTQHHHPQPPLINRSLRMTKDLIAASDELEGDHYKIFVVTNPNCTTSETVTNTALNKAQPRQPPELTTIN